MGGRRQGLSAMIEDWDASGGRGILILYGNFPRANSRYILLLVSSVSGRGYIVGPSVLPLSPSQVAFYGRCNLFAGGLEFC
jgi:hypothetical protein